MLSRALPDPDRRPGPDDDDDPVSPALERLRSELAETLDRLEDAVEELGDDDADGGAEGSPRNG